MTIILNGQKKEVPDGITVQGLLEHLNVQQQRVAVERNEEIVKKAQYAGTVLSEGDALEVVSFMGGGQVSARLREEIQKGIQRRQDMTRYDLRRKAFPVLITRARRR